MSWIYKEADLPKQWRDQRIQSVAGLLSFAPDIEVLPESVEQAEERLASAADEFGLDPDEVFVALRQHEPVVGFQEEDNQLLEGAFYEFL